MKKLIIFLSLVLIGLGQALGQGNGNAKKQPILPYDENRTKEELEKFSSSGSKKAIAWNQIIVQMTGVDSMLIFFGKLKEEEVSLIAGKYRNCCWDVEKEEIVSFLGKDYTGKVFTYDDGETKLHIKRNCVNILTLVSNNQDNTTLRDEDLPYFPPKEIPEDQQGKDYFVDTEKEVVNEVPNGTTINNFYLTGLDRGCYERCGYTTFLSYWSLCIGWGWYYYPSPDIYWTYKQPVIYNRYENHYYEYNYDYTYRHYEKPNPGGGQDPGIDPNPDPGGGGIDPPPDPNGGGQDPRDYYGHREASSSDGSHTKSSSRDISYGQTRKTTTPQSQNTRSSNTSSKSGYVTRSSSNSETKTYSKTGSSSRYGQGNTTQRTNPSSSGYSAQRSSTSKETGKTTYSQASRSSYGNANRSSGGNASRSYSGGGGSYRSSNGSASRSVGGGGGGSYSRR